MTAVLGREQAMESKFMGIGLHQAISAGTKGKNGVIFISENALRGPTQEVACPAPQLGPHRLAWPRTPPFHGENRGSNPLGDADFITYCK